jgi:uncharacterized tellurite resistance protein B-like protein
MNFKDILNLFREGKATAKSHMKNLIEMATVDGKFAKEENDLLLSIASRNGISASRLEEIRANPASVPFEVPKDDEEKFSQLYDLVHMMIVDKEIHPEEARLSELFARKFGYPTSSVSGIIETIRNNIQNGSNAAETLTRVQYFLRFSEKAV